MTKAGFGEHLKREREMRGVSLDEICAATRISTRFLEALENEEWERLPGGVFNRGFVRAVARFLGLDEEGFVAEYALATSAPDASTALPNHQPAQPSPAHRWLWMSVLVVIGLLAMGWLGWRSYMARHGVRRAAAASAAASPSPAQFEIPAAASAAVATAEPAASVDAAPPPDGALQLKIEAGKGTTVKVSADGKEVFDGSIIAGQSRAFEAQTAFAVETQDAGALLLELNGQVLAPIGPPGRSGKVTLTRRDLKPAGGSH